MLGPKQRLSAILLILFLALAPAACGKGLEHDTGTSTIPSQTESQGAARERAYEDLIGQLEKKGYRVTQEEAEPDILQGDRRWLTLGDGENLSVYLYEDQTAMERDASFVSQMA